MGFENFLLYTEDDTNNKLTVTATKADAVDVDRNENVLLYKDFGADYFNALDIDFEIYLNSNSEDGGLGGPGLNNTVDDRSGFGTTGLVVNIQKVDATPHLLYLLRGNHVASDAYNCAVNTPYYCTFTRAAGNDTVQLLIYSDSGRTDLLDTLAVAGFGTTKWRYVYGFLNLNNATSGYDFDGYVQNLDLHTPIYEESCSDGLVFGDTPSTQVVFDVSVTDGFKVGDTPLAQLVIDVLATDGIILGDSPSMSTVKLHRALKAFKGRNLSAPGALRELKEVIVRKLK